MDRHFDCFMMPFFYRAMASGAIEDLTVIHDQATGCSISALQWDRIFDTLHSLQKLRVVQSPGKLDPSIWAVFQSPPSPVLQELWLSFLTFGEDPQGEEEGRNWRGLVGRLVNHCAERNQRGCRLRSLVIEAPVDPPPDLTSLLTPHVDHFEIREEVLGDESVWNLEFGSRRMFDLFSSV